MICMVCLALNVRLVGKSLNPYLPSSTPDASNGLFSLTSCAGPTSFCLPHSLLSSVCFFYFASRLELYASCMGILPSLMLTLSCVGPGSKASRRKLLRICDHHTPMYLQMRAPTPTVQSCGKCILHARKSVAYATPPPPVPTPIETFIV